MDSSIISGVIIAIGSLAGALAIWLRADGTRLTKQVVEQSRELDRKNAEIDLYQDEILRSRQDKRIHNFEQHPNGEGAIIIRPLPGVMSGQKEAEKDA